MIPIVTSDEMQRFDAALDPATSMDKAAEGIARAVEAFIYDHHLPPRVILLTGKGNNAGDAYTAGCLLLQKGFFVQALSTFSIDHVSPLCRARHGRFISQKGQIAFSLPSDMESYSLIIDGLVGTGFQGKAEGPLAHAIDWANRSGLPIFSIDIPSGLNGTTGDVATTAIQATATLYLGFPKIGFFIGQGWDHVGKLIPVDIGLPPPQLSIATLLDPTSLKLPSLKRSRHKYTAGYVLGIAGSPTMPGAAALAASGVLHSGAGIVRLLTLPGTPSYPFLPEVIHEDYNLARIQEESQRAAAFFVGPGLGRTSEVEKLLYQLLPSLSLPCVLDADALYFLAKNPSWNIPSQTLLTPHHKEMKALLQKEPSLETCQHYAEHHKTTVVLKGAPTIIFHPGKKPLIIAAGDPGMATAGTGDVLTGIIAGLLAQKMEPLEAAILGAYLHGRAGELAAKHLTSYGMIASDILSYLPEALKEHCK